MDIKSIVKNMPNQEQLINKRIDISYWFVTHKILLRNILIVLLIIVELCLFAYIAFLLIFNLVIAKKDYQAILQDLSSNSADYSSLKSVTLPQGIKVVRLESYTNNDNFDIMAEIANPSTKWWAKFDYQFQINKEFTALRTGFILPGEQKTLLDLNVKNGDAASNLVFQNIKWFKELDFFNLVQERYLFDIQNILYIPAKELGVGDKTAISRASFEVTNNTAFSYTNLNLLVFLKSGDQTVGINQVSSGVLKSQQTKKLEVTFFQPLPRITSVDIIPEVNILDKAVYQ